MLEIKELTTRNLSFFRTLNHFLHYGEFHTLSEFEDYCRSAKDRPIYILGNGSNTFFPRHDVKTLVLKNRLERTLTPLPGARLEVTSSVLVAEVLRYCYDHSLASFYYLASVPATIGGALAMNAGRGQKIGWTIFDYVESLTVYADGQIYTLKADEIQRSYRKTMFTGLHTKLILKAVFKFPPQEFTLNPIRARLEWSKLHQDTTAPNCGSIFKSYSGPILRVLKGFGLGKARYSPKTENWLLNQSDSGMPILLLILLTKGLHGLVGMRAVLEIILIF